MSHKQIKNKKELKVKKKEIANFFESNLKNHWHLSDHADRQATVMAMVSTTLFTLSLFIAFSRPESIRMLPLAVFTCCNIAVLIISFISLRAEIGKPKMIIQGSQEEEKINLLYAGHFHRLSFADYEQSLLERFVTQAILSGDALQMDYLRGVELGRKYFALKCASIVLLIALSTYIPYILYMLLLNN
ncbi:Pycsar system effector family protein [Pedobacter miscanthi]|uniref:Pycsar effector protein domain-containing protein n=1 Tax=Pedobacter miscanthi TaxID=2259170 RepID=A0A366L0U5_9SPHI|nr:Pycsar system effector family protein [Pedobacter miscanthi]RBQ06772.1 hypothetical protein DRW42_13440 [Pedobacter miscanthi]